VGRSAAPTGKHGPLCVEADGAGPPSLFLSALEFDQVDIRGFSIGSFIAQEIALFEASTAPEGHLGVFGTPGVPPGCMAGLPTLSKPSARAKTSPEGVLDVFLRPVCLESAGWAARPSSACSPEQGVSDLPHDVGNPRSTVRRPFCAWGVPNRSALQRVSAIGPAGGSWRTVTAIP